MPKAMAAGARGPVCGPGETPRREPGMTHLAGVGVAAEGQVGDHFLVGELVPLRALDHPVQDQDVAVGGAGQSGEAGLEPARAPGPRFPTPPRAARPAPHGAGRRVPPRKVAVTAALPGPRRTCGRRVSPGSGSAGGAAAPPPAATWPGPATAGTFRGTSPRGSAPPRRAPSRPGRPGHLRAAA